MYQFKVVQCTSISNNKTLHLVWPYLQGPSLHKESMVVDRVGMSSFHLFFLEPPRPHDRAQRPLSKI